MIKPLPSLSTDDFIAGIEQIAPKFDSATYPQENLPPDDWALCVQSGVLLPTIPREFGGRDSHEEMCRVVETLSEWHLPLGMFTTIVTAVALRPIALYATEEAKREVLPLFAGSDPLIAGFASTEPGCGSGMSGMTTTWEEVDGGYHIRGRKHWQAFSLSANWWLVSAKNDHVDDPGAKREYGYFIVKRSEGFRTAERYEPLGLKVIDYGLNEIDAVVPAYRRIPTRGRNLQPMVEMLMASRAMMAAMGCGFLRRISREARSYADGRQIGPAPESAIRFVQYRLRAIDSSYTICEALNHYLRNRLDMKSDMIGSFPAVQAIKTVATERMLRSALDYQQLVGGEGYRCGSPTNISAQAALDARVFTIFDGSNDLLSQQLAEYCLARLDGRTLGEFLAEWPLTAPAVRAYPPDLRFLNRDLRQEHLVLAGRAIAYLFAMTEVMRWATETDADPDRENSAIAFLKNDITGVASEFALLDTGILDDDPAAAADARANTVISRSLPERATA